MSPSERSGGGATQHPDILTRIGRFVGLSIAALVALWLLYKIRLVLLILIAGAAIAYALAPLVSAFSGNRPRRRGVGIAAAYLVVFVGLTSAGVFGFRPVVDDARVFATTLPQLVQHADAWLAQTTAAIREALGSQQAQREPQTGGAIAARLQSLTANLGAYVAGLATVGQSFATLVTAALLALVISAFILADPGYLHRQVFAVVPAAFRADAETLWGEIDVVLAAYVRGQILIAAVVGIVATLAMALMGVKYALILGLFTAVTQLIPQVGGAIGMVASVALSSLQSPALGLGVLILYAVLYQLSGNILGPLVMGKAVALHPMVILVATMIGTVLGGVVGLLLSVPVAAVLRVVWNFFYPRLAARWDLAPLPGGAAPAAPASEASKASAVSAVSGDGR